MADAPADGTTAADALTAMKELVGRRHVEWRENQIRWRWLLDTLEGGEPDRNAVYGPDRKGLPLRNLLRHKREYPDPNEFPQFWQGWAGFFGAANTVVADLGYGPFPGMLGADASATAQDDDYELRRARTPIPEWLGDAVECHLSQIYEQEVKRKGPSALNDETDGWWSDVDGAGTPIDDWMQETIAPMLMTLGCIDILFDHPVLPAGEEIKTQADVLRLGLNACVASYILPENMVWWSLDDARRYRECMVREYVDPGRVQEGEDSTDKGDINDVAVAWSRRNIQYRHWTRTEWVLLDFDGEEIDRKDHPYGRPPIVRLIDRKRHRTPHIGKSRYEVAAELSREYYNRDSELILSDTLQAHPLLSGPQDFCNNNGELAVGPEYILPMFKCADGNHFQGWEYISPDKDPAESLRKNKSDIREQFEAAAKMTKPAGASGTGKGTVSQSGVSKVMDHSTGNKLLASIAKSLAKGERMMVEMALLVLFNGDAAKVESAMAEVSVTYPAKFNLHSAEEMSHAITELQGIISNCGQAPVVEKFLLEAYIRQLLLGMDDEDYDAIDEEIEGILAAKAAENEAYAEAGLAARLRLAGGVTDTTSALKGQGTEESQSEQDPAGESASTMVTNFMPSVM